MAEPFDFPTMDHDTQQAIDLVSSMSQEREHYARLCVALLEGIAEHAERAGYGVLDVAPTQESVGRALATLIAMRRSAASAADSEPMKQAIESAGFYPDELTPAEVIDRLASEVRALVGALSRARAAT